MPSTLTLYIIFIIIQIIYYANNCKVKPELMYSPIVCHVLLIVLERDAIGISSFETITNDNNVMLLSTFLFDSIKIHLHREPRALTHLPKVTITVNACVLDLAACVMFWREKNRPHTSRGESTDNS